MIVEDDISTALKLLKYCPTATRIACAIHRLFGMAKKNVVPVPFSESTQILPP